MESNGSLNPSSIFLPVSSTNSSFLGSLCLSDLFCSCWILSFSWAAKNLFGFGALLPSSSSSA